MDVDDDLARLIDRRAKESGVSREEIGARTLEQTLFRYEDNAWSGDDPHAPSARSEPRGPTVRWEQVEAWMRLWGTPGGLPKPRPR